MDSKDAASGCDLAAAAQARSGLDRACLVWYVTTTCLLLSVQVVSARGPTGDGRDVPPVQRASADDADLADVYFVDPDLQMGPTAANSGAAPAVSPATV